MITVLLAAAMLGGACIAVGFAVPGLRALAVAGGAVLVLVVSSFVWLSVLGLAVVGAGSFAGRALSWPEGIWVLLPPLLPAVAFVLFFVFWTRRA